MMRYFSQYGQDEFIDKVVLNRKRNGFFVDIGAHDGINLSNSYYFESSRNFNGVCIEPNPKVFDILKRNRKCTLLNVCIAEVETEVKFLAIDGYAEMLSGMIDKYHPEHLKRIESYITDHGGSKQEIKVKAIPLHNINLLRNTDVDYMSIDTEGNEIDILRSIGYKKININCLSIENNYHDTNIEVLMAHNGFIKVYRLGDDDIYLQKRKYNLAFRMRRRIFLHLTKRRIKKT